MLATNLQFVFVLLSRFPTEKAYGVTTKFSAMAVNDLGYLTEIVTPTSYITNNFPIKVVQIGKFVAKILLSNRFKKFLRLRFNFFLVYYVCLIRAKYRGHNSIFWCRDIYLSYLLSIFSKKQVICEIHRTPKKFQSFFLQSLTKRKNVLIAPINHFLSDKYSLIPDRSVIAPMSVNQYDLKFFDDVVELKSNTIIYLGNPQSGEYDLNVNLINDAAQIILKTHPDWTIQVVGIKEDFYARNIKNRISKNVQVIGSIKREEVLRYLSKAKIGIVIYPELDWFKDSFPIKIVEYSAARLAIVASDTTSHRRVLDESRCIFFKVDSHLSLAAKISEAVNDKELLDSLARNSNKWVRNLTYQNRISTILEKLRI